MKSHFTKIIGAINSLRHGRHILHGKDLTISYIKKNCRQARCCYLQRPLKSKRVMFRIIK